MNSVNIHFLSFCHILLDRQLTCNLDHNFMLMTAWCHFGGISNHGWNSSSLTQKNSSGRWQMISKNCVVVLSQMIMYYCLIYDSWNIHINSYCISWFLWRVVCPWTICLDLCLDFDGKDFRTSWFFWMCVVTHCIFCFLPRLRVFCTTSYWVACRVVLRYPFRHKKPIMLP